MLGHDSRQVSCRMYIVATGSKWTSTSCRSASASQSRQSALAARNCGWELAHKTVIVVACSTKMTVLDAIHKDGHGGHRRDELFCPQIQIWMTCARTVSAYIFDSDLPSEWVARLSYVWVWKGRPATQVSAKVNVLSNESRSN
ncbi:hypothetical protein BCR44DRAFT_1436559 [Catenaria anguillulae PL171]|uniref:Uncharacterized protein n=1 Tax=Catenaria anguillulae PL171 TaxID=765915 RepID=A0A1Y2HKZ9_9FUNG|nr:hypothetical protein BCR44DRAFT_1436559 [Catenaria anguillulae PL171]